MQNLDSSQLAKLEQQIDVLVNTIQQFKNENGLLRQQLTHLLHENSTLAHKNQVAQQRLVHLITQLNEDMRP